MAVLKITFSPTGGTENCAYIVANTLSSIVEDIDLTDRTVDFTQVEVAPQDVCVIAVPSFGGRVPAVALERLAQIKGNGAKAVLMAVYGNREIDDTLLELKDVAESAGFKTIAAISAVAEHSMVRQFAANRPDAQDQMELERFATQIAARNAVGVFKDEEDAVLKCIKKKDTTIPCEENTKKYLEIFETYHCLYANLGTNALRLLFEQSSAQINFYYFLVNTKDQ